MFRGVAEYNQSTTPSNNILAFLICPTDHADTPIKLTFDLLS